MPAAKTPQQPAAKQPAAKRPAANRPTAKRSTAKRAAVPQSAPRQAASASAAAQPAASTHVTRDVKPSKSAKPAKPVKSAKPAKPAKPAKVVELAKAAKPTKLRQKPVRDSFTMPEADFALIAALKARSLSAERETKKSELLRAGLHALAALDTAALLAALSALAPVKVGRPKSGL